MEKTCKSCGVKFDTYYSDDRCPMCQFEEFEKEKYEDEEFDTFSGEYVICPYCGCYFEPHTSEDSELFEQDGENEYECDNCRKTFIIENYVSYSWETKKVE